MVRNVRSYSPSGSLKAMVTPPPGQLPVLQDIEYNDRLLLEENLQNFISGRFWSPIFSTREDLECEQTLTQEIPAHRIEPISISVFALVLLLRASLCPLRISEMEFDPG